MGHWQEWKRKCPTNLFQDAYTHPQPRKCKWTQKDTIPHSPGRCNEKAHSPSGKLTASQGVNWFSHFGCRFYFLHFSNRGLTHIQSAQSTVFGIQFDAFFLHIHPGNHLLDNILKAEMKQEIFSISPIHFPFLLWNSIIICTYSVFCCWIVFYFYWYLYLLFYC